MEIAIGWQLAQESKRVDFRVPDDVLVHGDPSGLFTSPVADDP
jgi:hypothetical protein